MTASQQRDRQTRIEEMADSAFPQADREGAEPRTALRAARREIRLDWPEADRHEAEQAAALAARDATRQQRETAA